MPFSTDQNLCSRGRVHAVCVALSGHTHTDAKRAQQTQKHTRRRQSPQQDRVGAALGLTQPWCVDVCPVPARSFGGLARGTRNKNQHSSRKPARRRCFWWCRCPKRVAKGGFRKLPHKLNRQRQRRPNYRLTSEALQLEAVAFSSLHRVKAASFTAKGRLAHSLWKNRARSTKPGGRRRSRRGGLDEPI